MRSVHDATEVDMAVTVKKVVLWRKEVENRPGALAGTLAPLAQAGGNLRVVMGYALPGEARRSVIEVFPVSGSRATAAAGAAGLAASPIPCLLVEGDDQAGLGARLTRAVADQGVNLAFLVAETVGRKFSAVFGFESDADAARAGAAIKGAAKPAKPTAKRKAGKAAKAGKARRR
jgi:hypothetical protein